jgi:arylsulfatase A-like enzyme
VFATVPLPRPPGFDEKAVADKPAFVRRRPRLTPSLFAGIQENYRQEAEALLSVDDAVSQVMTTLRQTGELGNTLVVFTSDNGFMHGEHRIRAAKVFPYEPSIKVPLIMRGPGVPAGLRTAAPVGNIDLAPTILAAARALPGRLEDGTSLFGQMADPAARSGRELLLEDGRGLRTVARYRGVRNDRYVYIRYSTGTRELYDLRRDPYELANRATDKRYARIVTLLDRRMRLLERCRGTRACGASRPKVALRVHPCEPGKRRVTVEGPEEFRVARTRYARRRGGVVRATVTMVDGRVVTLDRRVPGC